MAGGKKTVEIFLSRGRLDRNDRRRSADRVKIESDAADELRLFVMDDGGLERRQEVRRLRHRDRAGPGTLITTAFLGQLRCRAEGVYMKRESQ
jgi:hypothetical protein